MAYRASLIQSRSLYVGTANSVAPADGNLVVTGTATATTFIGALTGNASTATNVAYSGLTGTIPTWNQNTTGSAATLTTARTLTIGSTGKTFNGSANVAWTLAEIGAYAATNPSGFTNNTGTVTSVTLVGGTGISITGSPITSSGSITVTNSSPNVTTNISTTHNATNVVVNSSDGTNGTINAATSSLAGVMTADDKTKLDNANLNVNLTVATAAATAAKASTESVTFQANTLYLVRFTLGNSVSSPTLNGINIRLGTSNASTTTFSIGANTVVPMYYNATNNVMQITGSYRTSDSTEDFNLRWENSVQAGEQITQRKIIMEGVDGRYYPLTVGNTTAGTKTVSTREFRLNGTILMYNSATVRNENAVFADVYVSEYFTTANHTFNQSSGFVAYRSTFLVGTINASGNFVLDNTTLTSWLTQTLPTTDDGKVYIYLGITNNTTTAFRLEVTHPIYQYKDGAIRAYAGFAESAAKLTTARTLTVGNTGKSFDGSANLAWTLAEIGGISANQTITLSGDATGSGATAITVTLANSGVTAGTYNNVATQVRPFTVDVKGRVTGIGAAVTITPAFSDVTGKPTTLSGYGITDAVPSNRTIIINGTSQDLSANRTFNVGTVTSVAALTIGTTGTNITSTVATGTTTPVITINVPDASATARGVVTTGAQTFAGVKTFSSTIAGSINGNAATATTLQTARLIGGVSFNGSANINLPGVNAAGTQNTSGNAATASTAVLYNGVAQATYTSSLRANVNISGGGTITVNSGGSVLWSGRFIVISNGNGSTFSTNGYFDINCPTSGTITGIGGASNVTATAAGIPLGQWQALYYVLPIGSSSTSVAANFRVALYTAALEIPHNFVLICLRNGDTDVIKFTVGLTLRLNQSINTANFDARRSNFSDQLTTARLIGGVSFNGSANINLPGVNTAGTQNTTGNAAFIANSGFVTSDNWNTIIPTSALGFREVAAYTGANSPTPAFDYGVVVHGSGPNSAFQMYFPTQHDDNSRGLWYRSGFGGAFGTWKRLLEMDVTANIGTARGPAGARFQILSANGYNTAANTAFDIVGSEPAHNGGRLYGFRQKLENFGSSNADGVSLTTYGLQFQNPGTLEIFLSRIHNRNSIYTHQIGGNNLFMYPKTTGDTNFVVAFPKLASTGVVTIGMALSQDPSVIPSVDGFDQLWKIKYNSNVGGRATITQSSSVTLETRVLNKTTSGAYAMSILDTGFAKVRVTTNTGGVNAHVTMPAGNSEIDGRMFVLELQSTSGASGITAVGNTSTSLIAANITTEASLASGVGTATYMMMYSHAHTRWLVYSYFKTF